MHEIVAPIIWVLEEEVNDCSSNPLMSAIAQDGALEATSFWMFEAHNATHRAPVRPDPKKRGPENITDIVHFCTMVQNEYLKDIDPPLQLAITAQGIYPQIYGMRWARLLFGREFEMTHASALYLWDFLFANVYLNSTKNKAEIAPGENRGGAWRTWT